MKSRNYTIGLFLALLFFAAANFYSYLRMPEYSTMDDGFVYFGWPFTVYLYGGFWGHAVTVWTGVIGNVVVALCAGRVLGSTLEKTFLHRGAFIRRATEQVVEPERNQVVSHPHDLNA